MSFLNQPRGQGVVPKADVAPVGQQPLVSSQVDTKAITVQDSGPKPPSAWRMKSGADVEQIFGSYANPRAFAPTAKPFASNADTVPATASFSLLTGEHKR